MMAAARETEPLFSLRNHGIFAAGLRMMPLACCRVRFARCRLRMRRAVRNRIRDMVSVIR